MKHLKKQIGYAGFILCNAFLLYFFHSYINLTILILQLIFPVVSIACCRLLINRLQVTVEATDAYLHKGVEIPVTVFIHNPLLYGAINCYLKVKVGNLFHNREEEHTLVVPVYGRKGQTIKYPVCPEYSGIVSLQVTQLAVDDFLGFVTFKKEINPKSELLVLPEESLQEDVPLNAFLEGQAELEESVKKGNDFTEVNDIREYQPGDKLQNIHWKLSVKKDSLMVKERVNMSSRQLILVLELFENDTEILDRILDCGYGMAVFFVSQNLPFTLVWWSNKEQQLKETMIGAKEELVSVFHSIFYETIYNVPDMCRSMLPILKQNINSYFWIGSSSSSSSSSSSNRADLYGEEIFSYKNDVAVYWYTL